MRHHNPTVHLLGLIGHPIGHSVSPEMHNFWCERLQVPYRYMAFDVAPHRLSGVVPAMRTLRIRGFNVTIPHKEAIVPYLDRLEGAARILQAVNTLVHELESGTVIGYNTDPFGFTAALQSHGIQPTGVAIVLGAGGAACAVVFALLQYPLERIIVFNRTVQRAVHLVEQLAPLTHNTVLEAYAWDPDHIDRAIRRATLLVHATPLGMVPHTEVLPVQPESLHDQLTVIDLIYNPPETALLRAARLAGARTLNGLDMLIFQGARAFELWTGVRISMELIETTRKMLQTRLSSGPH